MTQRSIEELVNTWRPRYLRASRKEKTKILDEFIALTGYHCMAATRVFRKGGKPKRCDRRGRPKITLTRVKAALIEVWETCGRIRSKHLALFLTEIVEVLERKGKLNPHQRFFANSSTQGTAGLVHHQTREPAQGEDPRAHAWLLGGRPTGM